MGTNGQTTMEFDHVTMIEGSFPLSSCGDDSLDPLSDQELIEMLETALRVQGKTIFETFFNRYCNQTFGFAQKITSCEEDAKDVWAKSWSMVASQLRDFKFTKGHTTIHPWLNSIIRNQAAAFYRDRSFESGIDIQDERNQTIHADALSYIDECLKNIDEPRDIFADYVRSEISLQVLEAITYLKQRRDQKLINLRFLSPHTTKEIAEIMNMKDQAVRTALSRALVRLRAKIEELQSDKEETNE